jgi:hypothetical protein
MNTHRRDFLKTSGLLAATTFLAPASWPALTQSGGGNASTGGGKNPFKPVVGVKSWQGVPTFTIDGQPVLLPVFETDDAGGQHFDAFAKAGTRVFSMNTNTGEDVFGRGRATRPEPNRFDSTGLDAWARKAIATRPDALIMPRVCLWEPKWWTEANPMELELWEHGEPLHGQRGYAGKRKRASLASVPRRDAMARSLRNLIQHLQQSDYADRVFGYLLAAENTEEWWHWGQYEWGYSQPTERAFQAWLRRKYQTLDALRQAWGRPDLTFETAEVPSSQERRWNAETFRELPGQMNVVEFHGYWNHIIPETIDYFAGVVKEETRGSKPAGAFYAFMYQNPEPEHGQDGLGRYLASPHLDFAMATSGFGNRTLGGVDYGRETPLSVQFHGKVFYFDMDYSSHLNTERERQRRLARPGLSEEDKERIRQWLPEDFGDRESRGTNTEEDIALYRRVAGFTICSGMFQSTFDIAHGSFDSPELMTEVARLNRLFERAARHDRSSIAEILAVADEASCSYVTSAAAWGECDVLRSALRDTQFCLPKIGAPHDQVLLDDLHLVDLRRYKLVIFLNACHVTDAQRSMIEKVKRAWPNSLGSSSGLPPTRNRRCSRCSPPTHRMSSRRRCSGQETRPSAPGGRPVAAWSRMPARPPRSAKPQPGAAGVGPGRLGAHPKRRRSSPAKTAARRIRAQPRTLQSCHGPHANEQPRHTAARTREGDGWPAPPT